MIGTRDEVFVDENRCLVCGHPMVHVQACHLKCTNCGREMDCSDKGFIW